MFENQYESLDCMTSEATGVTDKGVHPMESQTTKFNALDCSSKDLETKGKSFNSKWKSFL